MPGMLYRFQRGVLIFLVLTASQHPPTCNHTTQRAKHNGQDDLKLHCELLDRALQVWRTIVRTRGRQISKHIGTKTYWLGGGVGLHERGRVGLEHSTHCTSTCHRGKVWSGKTKGIAVWPDSRLSKRTISIKYREICYLESGFKGAKKIAYNENGDIQFKEIV